MLATATVSLAGFSGVSTATTDDARRAQTEPLRIEDVTVDLGGATVSVSRAAMTFEDETLTFRLRGVTTRFRGRSVSLARATLTVGGVDAETFSTLRSAMVEAVSGESAVPLLAAVAAVSDEVPADASVRLNLGSLVSDGRTLADRVSVRGTVGGIVPEGAPALLAEDATLADLADLGPVRFDRLTVRRGNARFRLSEVVIERRDGSIVVSAPSGRATLPGRPLKLRDVSITLRPPADGLPPEHVEFLSRLRALARQGALTASAVRSAAAESGVTLANTVAAVRSSRATVSLGSVTERGETVLADVETGGTLAELLEILRRQL